MARPPQRVPGVSLSQQRNSRLVAMAQSIGTTFVPLPLIHCVNPDEKGNVLGIRRPARLGGRAFPKGVRVEALRPAHDCQPGSLDVRECGMSEQFDQLDELIVTLGASVGRPRGSSISRRLPTMLDQRAFPIRKRPRTPPRRSSEAHRARILAVGRLTHSTCSAARRTARP